MANCFLDTSALLKRYVREPGSSWVQSFFPEWLGNQIVIARITAVEMVSAVTRRARAGSITQAQAHPALHRFRRELTSRFLIIPVDVRLIESAMRLADLHALRGYDAVQLAAAGVVNRRLLRKQYPPLTFISADVQLNSAAAAEGLAVDDPNAHP